MTHIAVHCYNLTKTYQEVYAVRELDLMVMQGEVLALLGPSGCGKTTALRLIAGFESPDGGSITIDGRAVAGPRAFVPPEKRKVGMVFQNYALFPHLNVADNVSYGLERNGDRRGRMREVLALVGLSALETRYPHELSGGQQQRVALARALAPRPKVLLLDEPFSSLDAGRRIQVREEIRHILKASGTTTVFVTHDQEEALYMGDRVAVQHAGRIEQIGTPEEVYGVPRSRFVAEFMGRTDFLRGEVTAQGVRTEIGTLAQRVELPVGTCVDVAVHADDVTLVPQSDSAARVLVRLYKGTVNVYRVQLPSGQVVHSLQPHALNLEPGTPVRVHLDPGHEVSCFERRPGA